MMTLTDAANLCGVPYYKIEYAIKSGKVLAPARFMGRYVFTPDDVERFRKHFMQIGDKWKRKEVN